MSAKAPTWRLSLGEDLEGGFDGVVVGGVDAVALGLQGLQTGATVEDLVDVEEEEKLVECIGGAEVGLRIRVLETGLAHQAVAPTGGYVVEVAAGYDRPVA